MEQVSDLMRTTKEDWVATEPENTDLAIYLHFWRGDEMVVMLQTPLDRDTGLEAGHVGAAGFAATSMAITFESYHSSEGKSPNTGKPWEPHEMQYTFEAVPENRTHHWVTECLSTTVHERGGGFCFSSWPYVIENGKVVWGEKTLDFMAGEDDTKAQGVMFEYLQHAMSQPTLEEVIAEKSKDDPMAAMMAGLVTDPEQRLFHTDMATITMLEERKLITIAMLAAEPGTAREEMIRERLGDQEFPIGGAS